MNQEIKLKTPKGEVFALYDFCGLDGCPACGRNAKFEGSRPDPQYCKQCVEMPHTAHLHLNCRCGFKWLELTKCESDKVHEQILLDIAVFRNPPKPEGLSSDGNWKIT